MDKDTRIQDELNLVSRMRKEKYEKVFRELESVTFFDGYARFASENEVTVNGDKLYAERVSRAIFKRKSRRADTLGGRNEKITCFGVCNHISTRNLDWFTGS